jgi:hypothetical protein
VIAFQSVAPNESKDLTVKAHPRYGAMSNVAVPAQIPSEMTEPLIVIGINHRIATDYVASTIQRD